MSPEASKLLTLLRDGLPHREVYHGRDGGWFVTYGGGEVNADAVRELVSAGLVSSVYSDCPNDCYHVGKTLDVSATIEERKKHRRRKDAPRIYTDGTRFAARLNLDKPSFSVTSVGRIRGA